MRIQTPFTVLPKYFNDFHNYFNKANEELISYCYIPEYLRKQTIKIQKLWSKIIGTKSFKIILLISIILSIEINFINRFFQNSLFNRSELTYII